MDRKNIKLSELIQLLMYGYEIEQVDYYNDAMDFLYSFSISEIPLENEKIKKFNLYRNDTGKQVLEVIEA